MKYKKNYYFEKNYNPRVSVPNFENYLDKALMLSKKASEELKGIENIKYGNGPLQNLDIFGADKDKEKPIFIFLVSFGSIYDNLNGVIKPAKTAAFGTLKFRLI